VSATYISEKACAKHGTFIRYRSNGNCVECLRETNRAYQARKREQLLPKKRAWAKANAEKNRVQSSRWQKENRSKAIEIQRRARQSKSEEYRRQGRAQAAKRRAAQLNATPWWADLDAIKAVYLACPPDMEVDHIVPLQGENVCGLHIAWNLQYLTKSANSAKGNRHV
jgi:5-methylcytosine-specific restriction endonuclease McrA